MLVLSRRPSEQIVVPACRLTITVLGIKGNRVRLGVSAPPSLSVRRSEVLDRSAADDAPAECGVTRENIPVLGHVLIADTDEYLLGVYRTYLEQHGLTVATATSGVECMEKLRESMPDVLVIDPCVPWGSGDGVLAVIREDQELSRIRVIVLTDAHDRGVLYRLSPFRVDDFQIKPMSGKRLTERVVALMHRGLTEVGHETTSR